MLLKIIGLVSRKDIDGLRGELDMIAADSAKKALLDLNDHMGGYPLPLHLAVLFGDAQAALALVKHGADVNARDITGRMVLHHAVLTSVATGKIDDIQMISLMLDMGADRRLCDTDGKTPLDYALEHDLVKAVELLRLKKKIPTTFRKYRL